MPQASEVVPFARHATIAVASRLTPIIILLFLCLTTRERFGSRHGLLSWNPGSSCRQLIQLTHDSFE